VAWRLTPHSRQKAATGNNNPRDAAPSPRNVTAARIVCYTVSEKDASPRRIKTLENCYCETASTTDKFETSLSPKGSDVKLKIALSAFALTALAVPSASAQSLDFGSLSQGSGNSNNEDTVTPQKGAQYFVNVSAHQATDALRCKISVQVNDMISEVPQGRLGWIDKDSGRTWATETWNPSGMFVEVMFYPVPGYAWNEDWAGTDRNMEFFVIDRITNENVPLGNAVISIPYKCPLDRAGSLKLQTDNFSV